MEGQLLEIVICPSCEHPGQLRLDGDLLRCVPCGESYRVIQGRPVFSSIPSAEVGVSNPKAPGTGSFWRRSNAQFVKRFADKLATDKVALEIGVGSGYCRPLFNNTFIGTDMTLRTSVDFVCNLENQNVLRPEVVDLLLMSNLLEHVFDFDSLMRNALVGLKSGGVLLVMVPWGPIHYVPHDYFRYTHFTLARFAERYGLEVEHLEAVYQPFNPAIGSIINLEKYLGGRGLKVSLARLVARFTRRVIFGKILPFLARGHVQMGAIDDLDLTVDHKSRLDTRPLGYQVAYRKQ